MFIGGYLHTIDPKGRVIIPSKLREQLTEKGDRFIITQGFDGCLFIFTMDRWASFHAKLQAELPLSSKEGRAYERYLYGSAAECELDKQGRILIPQELRTYAGLEKDIRIVGLASRVEIWSKARWEVNQADESMAPENFEGKMASLGF